MNKNETPQNKLKRKKERKMTSQWHGRHKIFKQSLSILLNTQYLFLQLFSIRPFFFFPLYAQPTFQCLTFHAYNSFCCAPFAVCPPDLFMILLERTPNIIAFSFYATLHTQDHKRPFGVPQFKTRLKPRQVRY